MKYPEELPHNWVVSRRGPDTGRPEAYSRTDCVFLVELLPTPGERWVITRKMAPLRGPGGALRAYKTAAAACWAADDFMKEMNRHERTHPQHQA